jgi:ABC-type transporter Mla MlaB component
MLRINVTEDASGQKWILQGRLTKSSIYELVSLWNAKQICQGTRIVDLRQVTSIDKAGESVLLRMIRDDAEFITAGVYTEYLLQELRAHPEENRVPPDEEAHQEENKAGK